MDKNERIGYAACGLACLAWIPVFVTSSLLDGLALAVGGAAGIAAATIGARRGGLVVLATMFVYFAVEFLAGGAGADEYGVAVAVAAGLGLAALGAIRGEARWLRIGLAAAGIVQIVWIAENAAAGAWSFVPGNLLWTGGALVAAWSAR